MSKFLVIISDLNKSSRLPRHQTLAVGNFPLARSQQSADPRPRDQRIKAYRLCVSKNVVIIIVIEDFE